MAAFSSKRAADRAKMAAALIELAQGLGASAEIGEAYGERETRVDIITPRGLRVSVDFDGDCSLQRENPPCWVLAWNIDIDSDARLSDAFAYRGEVNPFHHRKSTQTATGFDAMLANVRRGLTLAASGAAFCAEREAFHIAKDGTAADRKAQFAQWRAELAAETRKEA